MEYNSSRFHYSLVFTSLIAGERNFPESSLQNNSAARSPAGLCTPRKIFSVYSHASQSCHFHPPLIGCVLRRYVSAHAMYMQTDRIFPTEERRRKDVCTQQMYAAMMNLLLYWSSATGSSVCFPSVWDAAFPSVCMVYGTDAEGGRWNDRDLVERWRRKKNVGGHIKSSWLHT